MDSFAQYMCTFAYICIYTCVYAGMSRLCVYGKFKQHNNFTKMNEATDKKQHHALKKKSPNAICKQCDCI